MVSCLIKGGLQNYNKTVLIPCFSTKFKLWPMENGQSVENALLMLYKELFDIASHACGLRQEGIRS